MAQLVDRSGPGEARWQVKWKPSRDAPWRTQSFRSPAPSRGKSPAQRDAERLRAYVDLHQNLCEVEEALAVARIRRRDSAGQGYLHGRRTTFAAEWLGWVAAAPGQGLTEH
jgi:hypothetical protein